MKKLLLFLYISFVFTSQIIAQSTGSPPNLTNNISLIGCNCSAYTDAQLAQFGLQYAAFFNNDNQIPTAFNYARRAEEMAFGLPANSLGNMVLPNNYSSLNDNQKGLFIVNSERQARSNIDYDLSGPKLPVLGLPFEGIDAEVVGLALEQAEYMVSSNTFSHIDANMNNAFTRLENKFGTKREFLARSENIYASCGGASTHVLEQALFSFIYQDSPSWGHRAAILIQDRDPAISSTIQNGFKNNFGSADSEGFIGFGVLKDIPSYPVVCGPAGGRLAALLAQSEANTSQPLLNGNIVVMLVLDPSLTFVNTPLPLSLTLFDLQKTKENIVQLKWQTSSEKNSFGFEIEKSIDAKRFTKIGFIKSNINSNELANYSFEDDSQEDGINYYRLKLLDIDGSFEYSPVKSVKIEKAASIKLTIQPNPAESLIKISNILPDSQIDVIDNLGKFSKLKTIQSSKHEETINVSDLQKGVYYLRVLNNNNLSYLKFVVQ